MPGPYERLYSYEGFETLTGCVVRYKEVDAVLPRQIVDPSVNGTGCRYCVVEPVIRENLDALLTAVRDVAPVSAAPIEITAGAGVVHDPERTNRRECREPLRKVRVFATVEVHLVESGIQVSGDKPRFCNLGSQARFRHGVVENRVRAVRRFVRGGERRAHC